MIKNENLYFKIVTGTFLAIELFLMISILFIKKHVAIYESIATLTTFVYSLFFIFKNRQIYLVQLALLFTFIADFCLLMLHPREQILAMIFFSIVQVAYAIKLYFNDRHMLPIIIRTLLIIFFQIIGIIVVNKNYDFLVFLSLFYFSNLILNLVLSATQIKKSPLFFVGLLLFLLCDIFIGLQEANNTYLSLNENSFIYKFLFSSFNFAWLFYLPSQVCIAITCPIEYLHSKNRKGNN